MVLVEPASMSISAPWNILPSGPTINSTIAAISSGSPMRAMELLDVLALGGVRVEPAFFRQCVQARGVARGTDGSRVNRVDLHTIPQAQVSQGFRKRQQRGIDRSTDGELRAGRPAARAGDEDNGSRTGLEVRPTGRVSRTDPKNLRAKPSGEIVVGQLQELATLGGAGIVHNDVKVSESLDRELNDALAGIGQTQIQGDGFRDSSGPADLGRGRIEQLLIAGGEHHTRPGGRQTQGDAASNPAAGSGHNRDFVLQRLGHRHSIVS